MNWELPDIQAGFRKGRGTRDQIADIQWNLEKARKFQQNTYICFTDYAKAFNFVDHNKLWKTLKDMGIPDYLTCLLRNLDASRETAVRTLCRTTDWLRIEKGAQQRYLLAPCLFNLYTDHMWNAGLDELQEGIKISRRNINHLKYADDMTLKVENEEELKNLLVKLKKKSEKKTGLKFYIFKKQYLLYVLQNQYNSVE